MSPVEWSGWSGVGEIDGVLWGTFKGHVFFFWGGLRMNEIK